MTLNFLAGLVTMGFAVIALFFFRYWRRTHDALLAWFGGAFFVLACNQALAELVEYGRDELSWVWLLRLVAFSFIIVGIVQKNARSRG
jgi:zinc transporter ZupT